MTVPSFQDFLLPTLKLFAEGKKNVAECLPDLKAQFDISDEDAEQLLPSGRITLLASRTHWARTYLSKAGLLRSPHRNHHVITDLGRTMLKSRPDFLTVADLARTSEDFAGWHTASRSEDGSASKQISEPSLSETLTPEEQMETAHKAINAALRDDILTILKELSPERFEKLIVDVLRAMGFGGGRSDRGFVTKSTGDGGIDGIIHEDALGLDAVYVQAKRYDPASKVGRPDIQRFVGSLTGESATKDVFVTTSSFSSEARAYIERVQQRIVLIDGQRIAQLMIDYEVGVRGRKSYIVRSVDDDYFSPIE